MDVLVQMLTFVRVVEAGGLTAAARQLHRSPAAVSRQLAALEAHLGAQLLTRNTRRSRVTEAGRTYYERCLRVAREVEDARRAVRGDAAMDGVLVVSAPVSFGLARICPHLPSLLALHPRLRVDLRLEDRLVDLSGEGVDVAVRSGVDPPDSNALVARPLLTYRRRLVASPAYLVRRGTPAEPGALEGHDLLFHLGASPGGWRLSRDGHAHRLEASARFRSNAPFALLEAARHGAGIALLPEWLVEPDIEQGRLRGLLAGWDTEPVRVFALHRAELRGAPRVRAFVDHLLAAWSSTSSAARTLLRAR